MSSGRGNSAAEMVPEPVTIRAPSPRDVKAITGLAHICGLSEWRHDDYISELTRGDSIFFTAFSKDSVVGFVIGRTVPGEADRGPDAEIYNIASAPALRNSGIGSSLLARFVDECGIRNVHRVWLEVRESNETAIRFYRKHGFLTQFTRPAFYSKPAENALVMMAETGGTQATKT